MSNKVHVKKGNKVIVLQGKDKGVTGEVLDVNPEKGTVLVKSVNMVTKHYNPRTSGNMLKSGIVKEERHISSSNVMQICDKCKKPSRMSKVNMEDGSKVKMCKKCGEVVEIISKPKNA